MTAVRAPFVYCGLRGSTCYRVSAIVDTGSDLSVVPQRFAQMLGLEVGELVPVNTGGGLTPMYRSKARIAAEGQPSYEVDVWVNGTDASEVTVGANALRALGFQLLPPSVNGDALNASGVRVPDAEDLPPSSYSAVTESRLAVCASCAYRGSFLGVETCTVCHCPLATKTRIPSSPCPMGKW